MTNTYEHLTDARKTAHASVRRKGEATRQAVYHELRLADQPLVASEIRALLAKQGIALDPTYIRTILKGFVMDGSASTRNETADERLIRNGGRSTRGNHQTAMYYWAPAGKVPFRTQASTVMPVTKKKKKSKPVQKAAPVRTTNTDLINRIESMTNELALLQRVAMLEDQLAEIRRVIR
jgi:hypothetical protein